MAKENKLKKKLEHWYLLKDTDGKKSISFTMVFAGFGAVTLWLVVSIAEELLGIKIREFSGTEALAYLAPIFSIYFGRKQQKNATAPTESEDAATPEE